MEPLLSSDSVGSILPGGVGGGGGGTVSAESTTGTAVTGSAAATAGTCATGTAAAPTGTPTAGSGGRAGCTRSRAAIGVSTAGAAFMVVSVLVLVSGHYSVGLLMTFQAVHLVAAIVIVFGGAPVVTAAASRSLFGAASAASGHHGHHHGGGNAAHSDNNGNDKSNNGPTVIAVVSVLLLSVTAVVDIVATLLQILARNDTVLWSSLAEDAFTVPECIVMAAVLVMLELNPRRRGAAAAGDDATLHLVVLPAIIGVSASFILLNITGTNTWDDTSDSFGSLR